MKYSMLNRCFLTAWLLTTGMYASSVAAVDWYRNNPELNRMQGFGDFPPVTLEQDLDQQKLSLENSPIVTESEPYQDSNLWDNGAAPVDHKARQPSVSIPPVNAQRPVSSEPKIQRNTSPLGNIYQPDLYAAPGYGTYNPGIAAPRPYPGNGSGPGGPWNNRGSGFQGPWNNTGSGFSPWGGRGGSGNGINPFGSGGPGGWFNN